MDFYDVLNQVITLLQREGRVSYRVLKRQFSLDDDFIEDLKEELIYSKRLAVDEEGRVLVWTGEAGAPPEPTSTSTPPAQPEATQEAQLPQGESPPPEPPTPDAERRQLTVMFCDLADSTKLSAQLDPEDLRDVIRAYQEAAAGVIQRYEGHIAQYLGDGLLVYFGWPQAHEDDARRAVHAGLGIIKDMGDLNTRLEKDKGVRLAVRIGIHTGPVVIGEMGGGGRHEQLALGETTNIASRLEGIAQPNTVVIGETTYRLVEGYFSCDDLGTHALKGVSTPMLTYRVRQATGVQGRLDVAMGRGLTPLVGREQEVGLLVERWTQVQEGQGQIILLSGEAGIGKSRLVQVLKEHLAEAPHTQLECRSSPYYQNTALYPITDLLQRTLQWQQDDTVDDKLVQLEQMLRQYQLPLEETVPLFATLLSLPIAEERYLPLNWTPQRQRQKMLEAIVAMLLEQAEGQPVLFILEDLHWTDATTLELLDLLIEQTPTARIYTLLTCRPEFQVPWSTRSYLTQVTLNRLSRSQIARMAERVAHGKRLPVEVLEQIIAKTDGVPLFVEEMTKAVLESGSLKETDDGYVLTDSISTLAIPATLQDSLVARLDRLMTGKVIAQLGAVIGRQFPYELLQAVSQLDETMLQHELDRLVDSELCYQRGRPPQATYVFKHALIQDAAYQSLLKATLQQYHQRIAHVLEAQFPETVETQPELLAHHFTKAGLIEPAIRYWQGAGQRALERSAHVEAIGHLTAGLELLQTLPDTPARAQRELHLLTAFGAAFIAIKGYAAAEVEHVLSRAYVLCQQVGDTRQHFSVLYQTWWLHCLRAEYTTARGFGDELLCMAQQQHDLALLVAAHRALGTTVVFLGEIGLAREHWEQCLALHEAALQSDLTVRYGGANIHVTSHTWMALTGWLLGYPDQALAWDHDALRVCQDIGHPFDLAWVHTSGVWLHEMRREVPAARQRLDALDILLTEQAFPFWTAWSMVLGGWLQSMQGQTSEGIAQIRQSFLAFQNTGGGEFNKTYFLDLLATAYEQDGQPEAALTALAEALGLVEKNAERWREAEIHRRQGELLLHLSLDNHMEAESCFQKALSVARHQQAKSWELRAATSLARLWRQQGKRQEAHDLLAPVYGWFTEGFDTADLKDAKALLEELEEGYS